MTQPPNPEPAVELRAGSALLRLELAAGRITSLVLRGRERILAPPVRPRPTHWGCFLMAPWVGRLEDARLPVGDRSYQLPADEGGHALHGTARTERWTVDAAARDAVTVSCTLGPPWPLGGTVRQRLVLNPGRLDLEATVRAGGRPMPAALGWHPWFLRPGDGDVALRLDADGVLVTEEDLVATGAVRPVGAAEDLRGGPVGDRRLDTTYVGARSPAVVGWPDLELDLAWGPEVAAVTVYTPAHAVCVEPLTAWPNAPVLHARGVPATGLALLGPEEALTATTTWTWQTA